MQEHSGQVRGQARAPVGRYGGGWLWTRWTLRFPYDSTTPHPPFLTSALYRRRQSTQLTPAMACALWAHRLERARVASGVRSFALAISREPSHPLLGPQTERCHVFTGLWRPPAGFPAPLLLPTPALYSRLRGRSSLLCQGPPCVWIHRKGPGRTVALSFQDPSVSYHANTVHKRTEHFSAPSSVVGRFPHLFSLDDHRLRIESAV